MEISENFLSDRRFYPIQLSHQAFVSRLLSASLAINTKAYEHEPYT